MLVLKMFSSEWCDADVYEIVDKFEASKFEVCVKDIKEFNCVKGDFHEKKTNSIRRV